MVVSVRMLGDVLARGEGGFVHPERARGTARRMNERLKVRMAAVSSLLRGYISAALRPAAERPGEHSEPEFRWRNRLPFRERDHAAERVLHPW
jgi:hypothetical protein